jgi:hypothetical protein
MNPDLLYWGWFVAGVAWQVTAVVLLAFGLQRFSHSPQWQRSVWRATLVCLWIVVFSKYASGYSRSCTRGAAGAVHAIL